MSQYGPCITACTLFASMLLGLAVGSFVNCWAWRSVRGESIARGRSCCPACGHVLAARDLVPVFSWLALKGRCRYCHEKVSVRYPVAELVCAGAFAAIVGIYGITLETAELLVFASVLLFVALTDIDQLVIPDAAILVALGVRAVYLAFAGASGKLDALGVAYFAASSLGVGAAMLVFTLVADFAFGRDSMGGGDIKLYAVCAAYTGWQGGVLLVIMSCLIGIVVGIAYGRASAGGKEVHGSIGAKGMPECGEERAPAKVSSKPFPFGPSIAVSCFLVLLAGEPFISWYLSLI